MAYKIDVIVNSTPDEHGFCDFITLREDGVILNSSIGSGSPNPYRPTSKQEHWTEAYGCIAPGIYPCETIADHHKFGRCVVINGGKAVPTRNPNPNHGGKMILTQGMVHAGGTGRNKSWRGSGGCVTVSSFYWERFQIDLPDGNGFIEIIDASGRV